MNPRAAGDFLKSKFGLFLVFLVVLFTGLWIYSGRSAAAQEAAKSAAPVRKDVELGQVKIPLDQGLESGVPQQTAPRAQGADERQGESGALVPFRPASATAKPQRPAPNAPSAGSDAEVRPRKRRVVSLLASYQEPVTQETQVAPAPPTVFIPYGTLLKCKLVNTVDSSNVETPLVAVLLEDVWQNGRRVLPANLFVHGVATSGRLRDRVNAQGVWRLVWADGRELAFSGVALDRQYHHEIDGYGITDGSAGIRGRVIATDGLQELKMLASAALSGFARGTQDRTQTALGSTITGSVSNGVREGVGDVFELYAQRTLRDIEEHGYFVRIPAGKEFYVYVREMVDATQASIGGRR